MPRPLHRSILAALGLAIFLAGCAEGQLADRLPPDMGGLPAGTPARPAAPYQYPAVHDMPPPRATEPMSDEEQVRLEKELQGVRDRQERQEAGQQAGRDGAAKKTAPVTSKKPAPPKKKPPAPVNIVPPAGANSSGTKINP